MVTVFAWIVVVLFVLVALYLLIESGEWKVLLFVLALFTILGLASWAITYLIYIYG